MSSSFHIYNSSDYCCVAVASNSKLSMTSGSMFLSDSTYIFGSNMCVVARMI